MGCLCAFSENLIFQPTVDLVSISSSNDIRLYRSAHNDGARITLPSKQSEFSLISAIFFILIHSQ